MEKKNPGTREPQAGLNVRSVYPRTTVMDPKVQTLLDRAQHFPAQRTEEWYAARNDRLTASSIASVLRLTPKELALRDQGLVDLPASKRVGQVVPAFQSRAQLLRSKAGADDDGFTGSVFTEWGVAYEPVVTELYKLFENTDVLDFGLVPHPALPWLGASPDGVTPAGRMLEIKCPFSRTPTGVPKLNYWMQMQIQMECCDLDACDFVEVAVQEYPGRAEYLQDVYTDPENGALVPGRAADGMAKGFIVECVSSLPDTRPTYWYPPTFRLQTPQAELDWLLEWTRERFPDGITEPQRLAGVLLFDEEVYRVRYWKIGKWLQTTVHRDREWFEQRRPELQAFWREVEDTRAGKLRVPAKRISRSRPKALDLADTAPGATECEFIDV